MRRAKFGKSIIEGKVIIKSKVGGFWTGLFLCERKRFPLLCVLYTVIQLRIRLEIHCVSLLRGRVKFSFWLFSKVF